MEDFPQLRLITKGYQPRISHRGNDVLKLGKLWKWEMDGFLRQESNQPVGIWEILRKRIRKTGDTLLMLHYKPIVCLSIYYDFSTSLNHANVQLKWISIYLQAPRDSLIGAWHGMIDGYLFKLEAKTLGSASKQIGPWGDMAMFNSYVKLPECTYFWWMWRTTHFAPNRYLQIAAVFLDRLGPDPPRHRRCLLYQGEIHHHFW